MSRTKFQKSIAGPLTGPGQTGLYPALKALNSVSEVLGPGYLAGIKDVIFMLRWLAGVTTGSLVLEGANDPKYTGTWAPLITVNFTDSATAAPRIDQVNYSAAQMSLRWRVTTLLDGLGVEIEAA